MANDNNFLTIPSQEALFKTVKHGRTTEEVHCHSPMDEDDDDETEVRLIPRCSPVPRKRGLSIFEETAEYLRTHLTHPTRRVSFADTTGGDLTDVKEFVAFDSDEEEVSWEDEESDQEPLHGGPIYRVCPEFELPTDMALKSAVRTNKVEVERISPLPYEPLAFTGLIRVLNISFHKSVYVRSTMDKWVTFFDYPAEYVQGSNDVETDTFSFKLAFSPPYLKNGSCIEFVVRFETPEGIYWANNTGRNYVVTLHVSYKDVSNKGDFSKASGMDRSPPKGILKLSYRIEDDKESPDDDEEDSDRLEKEPSFLKPTASCPQIIQPEIDIETSAVLPGPLLPLESHLLSREETISGVSMCVCVSQPPHVSTTTTSQTNQEAILTSQVNQSFICTDPKSWQKPELEAGDQTQDLAKDAIISTPTYDVSSPSYSTITPPPESNRDSGQQDMTVALALSHPHVNQQRVLPTTPEVEEETEEDLWREKEHEASEGNAMSERVQVRPSEDPLRAELCEGEDQGEIIHFTEGDTICPEVTPTPQDETANLTPKKLSTVEVKGVSVFEAGPRLQSSQASGEKEPVKGVSLMWNPPGFIHLGVEEEERVPQSMARPHSKTTTDPRCPTVSQEPLKQRLPSALTELPAQLSVELSGPKKQADQGVFASGVLKIESQTTPDDVRCTAAASPEFLNIRPTSSGSYEVRPSTMQIPSTYAGRSPITIKRSMAHREEEEPTQDYSETKQTSEVLTTPRSAWSGPTLNSTMGPSIVFLSLVICAIVGLEQPRVLLLVGLFLILLLFF